MTKAIIGWLIWAALRLYTWRRKSVTFPAPNGSPYMTRWPIWTRDPWPDANGRTGGEGFYLHRIVASDHERELHCHPAPSCAVVLRGGYEELRKEGPHGALRLFTRKPLSLNVLGNDSFHRVELHEELLKDTPHPTVRGARLHVFRMRPSWSLFYLGPRSERGWGFLQSDGTVRRAAHHDGNTGARVDRPGTVRP